MRASRRTGRRILLASLVVAASVAQLNLVGCSGGGASPEGAVGASPSARPETVPDNIPQCSLYANVDEDAYGYCIYKFAGGFPTVADVDRLCPQAGKWAKECRHAWVAGRMPANSGVETEVLLAVCDKNPDCTFELLDFRPDPDVTVQMKLCSDYAGPYAGDCVSHAMQRWFHQKPDADEVARVAAYNTPHFDKHGYWIGAVVGCRQVGACPSGETSGLHCRHSVDVFTRTPASCPADTKAPLPHNKNRPPHGGARPPASGATPPTNLTPTPPPNAGGPQPHRFPAVQ